MSQAVFVGRAILGRGRGMYKDAEIRACGDALDDKKAMWLEWNEKGKGAGGHI